MKKKPSIPVEELFSELFADQDEIINLLNVSLEDESEWAFFVALKEIIECGEVNKSALARKTKLSRVHLYRILSKTGNPSFKIVRAFLDVLGLEFQIQAKPIASKRKTGKSKLRVRKTGKSTAKTAKSRVRKTALKR